MSLPMIDTEILLAVDDATDTRWVPEVVIEHEDNGQWFQVRYEGEIVDLPLSAEGKTWKRIGYAGARLVPDALARAERDYREAAQRADELRASRNELVAQALREGWTHARIAEATGLSRGRISQLR